MNRVEIKTQPQALIQNQTPFPGVESAVCTGGGSGWLILDQCSRGLLYHSMVFILDNHTQSLNLLWNLKRQFEWFENNLTERNCGLVGA